MGRTDCSSSKSVSRLPWPDRPDTETTVSADVPPCGCLTQSRLPHHSPCCRKPACHKMQLTSAIPPQHTVDGAQRLLKNSVPGEDVPELCSGVLDRISDDFFVLCPSWDNPIRLTRRSIQNNSPVYRFKKSVQFCCFYLPSELCGSGDQNGRPLDLSLSLQTVTRP